MDSTLPAQPGNAPRKRGPKPVGDRAMTGAERTRAYRERLQEHQDLEAFEQLSGVALREKLNRALLEVERFESGRAKVPAGWKDIEADLREGALYAAQLAWQEVGRRFGFKLSKRKPSR
jgi:hypothetical protein